MNYIFPFSALIIVIILSTSLNIGSNGEGVNYSSNDSTTPCSEPLTYRIGSIDERYSMSRGELKNILDEVQVLWESAMKQDLMNYRENGELSIHLQYSDKQQMTQQEKSLSSTIENLNQQIENEKKQYEQLSSSYVEQKKQLKSMIAHYEGVVKKYNDLVESYNQNGGVPPSKKPEIENFRRRIKMLESKINNKKETVESHRERANQQSDHINDLIDRQNQLIRDYNQKFAEAKKFNQGNYYRRGNLQRINIFQFSNLGELKAVLAHEFGHAFGIGHLDNPKAIMYPVMQQQNIYNLSLTKDDIQALQKICDN